MERVLFVNDNTELCDLVKPFLKNKGIELSYCSHSKKWSLKMTSLPIAVLSA